MNKAKLGVAVSVALVTAACVSAPVRREPDFGITVPDRWLADPNLPGGGVASEAIDHPCLIRPSITK